MKARATLIVKGVVQGVGFRYFALQEATQLGLVGQVGNLYNGDVKVLVEGERSAIQSFIKSLSVGPPMAHVSDIRVEWQSPTNEFKDFRITYFR